MAGLRLPPNGAGPSARTAFLREVERRFEPLRRGATLADWRLLMGRSSVGSLPWQLRIHRLFSLDGLLPWTREARRATTDPATSRRLDLLEQLVTEAVLDQHPRIARPREVLEKKIVAFRPSWKGHRVDRATIRQQLRSNPDRNERRTAWYAMESLHRSIEGGVRALARLRNDRAKELGYRSYPEYRLGFEGFSVARLEELLEEAAAHVREAARAKRARFEQATGLRDWFPWDQSFADELTTRIPDTAFGPDEMVSAVLDGVRRWGFRPNVLRFPIDQHDLPSGGIEIPVDPPGDVRVIVHPGADWTHYMILFHEVGHTVQSRSNVVHSPLLRWHEYLPGFPGFIEGMGTLFESIPHAPSWLATRPGVEASAAREFARTRDLSDLVGMGWRITKVRVELALYRNPDADLDLVQRRLSGRLEGYDEFGPRSFADPFMVRNPMYLQSYVFAGLFARQLLTAMREQLGGEVWPNPRFGPWLVKNWFRHSGEFDWVPQVKRVTGKSFGAGMYNRWARSVLASVPED
jgi:peptidyl-dipeptidase A